VTQRAPASRMRGVRRCSNAGRTSKFSNGSDISRPKKHTSQRKTRVAASSDSVKVVEDLPCGF
jgi:hypothetical protein